MGRKKEKDKSVLSHELKTRVNDEHFARLSSLLNQSTCRNMSELMRDIVCNKKITVFTKDNSLTMVMEELIQLRRELNAIGNNINQTTRQLNSLRESNGKPLLIMQISEQFQQSESVMNAALLIITKLAKKWLQ